jgi:hypothetical protein
MFQNHDIISMFRRPSEIEGMLQTKFGFTSAEGHSSDHRWYELHLEGLPVILTKVSHTKREIRSGLEGKIARQLRVHKPYFDEMLDCTHNREDYYRQVRNDPYPPFDIRF